MLKRKNKILVGVLVLFLVMAVGYAIFTQTLRINGTATAQGNLNLTYECIEKDERGGTGTCLVNTDTNTITTTSNFSKPTDGVLYYIKVTNTGTIPAVLETVTSPNNIIAAQPDVSGDEMYLDKNTYLGAMYSVYKLSSTGEAVSDVLAGNVAVANAKITLQPGEGICVIIQHGWISPSYELGKDIPQPVLPEGGANIEYNVTFGFEQVTA